MDDRRVPPLCGIKLCSQAEDRMAKRRSECGIQKSLNGRQRTVHEANVNKFKLEVCDELEIDQVRFRKWIEEMGLVAFDFREISKKLERMSDCQEKVAMGVQLVNATISFIEERFKMLLHGDTADSAMILKNIRSINSNS